MLNLYCNQIIVYEAIFMYANQIIFLLSSPCFKEIVRGNSSQRCEITYCNFTCECDDFDRFQALGETGSIFAASNWQFISIGTFVAALFVASLGFQVSVVEWLHILEKTLEMLENIYITEDTRYINIYSETVIKQPCILLFKNAFNRKKKR